MNQRFVSLTAIAITASSVMLTGCSRKTEVPASADIATSAIDAAQAADNGHHASPVTPVPLSSAESAGDEDEDDSQFAFRLDVAYDFPLGRLSLTPLVSADLIDGYTTWVYGVALGFGL